MSPKGRYIKAEELVPKRKKKYDKDIAEFETIRFFGLKCCPLISSSIPYTYRGY